MSSIATSSQLSAALLPNGSAPCAMDLSSSKAEAVAKRTFAFDARPETQKKIVQALNEDCKKKNYSWITFKFEDGSSTEILNSIALQHVFTKATCQFNEKKQEKVPAGNSKKRGAEQPIEEEAIKKSKIALQEVNLPYFTEKTFEIWHAWQTGCAYRGEISAEDLLSLYKGCEFIGEGELAIQALAELTKVPDLSEDLTRYIIEEYCRCRQIKNDNNIDQIHNFIVDLKNATPFKKVLEEYALKDNRTALGILGLFYLEGIGGFQKDVPLANKYLTDSTKEPSEERISYVAQYQLGLSYLTGEGVSKDEPLGLSLLEKAAQQGHELAQIELADKLVAKKDPRCVPCLQILAEKKGKAFHQVVLARGYQNGFWGLAKDINKAAALYEKAAVQEKALAQAMLAILFHQTDSAKSDHWRQKFLENKNLEEKYGCRGVTWIYTVPTPADEMERLTKNDFANSYFFSETFGISDPRKLFYLQRSAQLRNNPVGCKATAALAALANGAAGGQALNLG